MLLALRQRLGDPQGNLPGEISRGGVDGDQSAPWRLEARVVSDLLAVLVVRGSGETAEPPGRAPG